MLTPGPQYSFAFSDSAGYAFLSKGGPCQVRYMPNENFFMSEQLCVGRSSSLCDELFNWQVKQCWRTLNFPLKLCFPQCNCSHILTAQMSLKIATINRSCHTNGHTHIKTNSHWVICNGNVASLVTRPGAVFVADPHLSRCCGWADVSWCDWGARSVATQTLAHRYDKIR